MEFKPSEEVVKIILDRLRNELQASFHYQFLSNWCESKGFDGFAKFYKQESDHEISHARMLQSYLNGWSVQYNIPSISNTTSVSSLMDSIEQSREIEQSLYIAYNNDCLFLAGKDFSAFSLFLKMVDIQKESIFEYNTLLDKCRNSRDLFIFDKEVFDNE